MKKFLGHDILAALNMPAILIGSDERIVAARTAGLPISGGSIEGRHYVTALRQPGVLDAIKSCLARGTPQTCPFQLRGSGGESTWLTNVAALIAADGDRHVLVTFQDVSAQEAAGKMRRDFVSNVSHELRTPLTAVLGFVETLRGAARQDPEAQARFLGIIDREARRMAQLVDDLLSLSRVEDDERRRPTELVDLGRIIETVVAGLAPLAEAQNVALVFEPPEGAITVPGDPRQLTQVMMNLISNAIKYGGADRAVEISLSAPQPEPAMQGEAVRIAVRDRGEGIAEYHIPRLTERFYRVDTHRGRDVGGTGLGLAIVKHIVSRHRGRLRIESTLGKGSTFAVLLPTD